MAANSHSLDLEAGSSQYATIADASQTGLDLTGDFTFEAFIRLESLPSVGNVYSILGKFSDQSDERAYRLDINSSGNIGVIVTDDGTWTDGHRLWRVGATGLASGLFYHIAVTFSIASEGFVFYVNGTSVGVGTLSVGTTLGATLHNSTAPFDIGIDRDTSSNPRNYFDGLIDEVRIWSDVRTGTEIKENMFKDVSGEANLVGYWKLNNDYTDSSGNSNTLTASGSPTFSTTVAFPEYTSITNIRLSESSLSSDANLIAYYKLEDVSDSEGSFTLTNNNSVSFTSGKFDNGGDLGTSNSSKYLSIANDLGITNGSITVSMWAKIQTAPSSSTYSLFEHGDSGTDIRYWIRYQHNGSAFFFNFNRQKENVANQSFNFTLNMGTSDYFHVVLTYDGSTVKAYLNAIQVGSVSASGDGSSGVDSDYTYLGAARSQAPAVINYASALLDDVAIFNDALTATEVFELYTGLNVLPAPGGFIYQSV